MMSGVYIIRILDKFYIGSSKNIPARIYQHLRSLEYGKHYNHRLQSSYNKYGIDYFTWSTLEYCSEYENREQIYIDKHIDDKLCINSSRIVGVANASPLTAIRRRETMRQRRLEGAYKHLPTPWKAAAARKGLPHTTETKLQQSKIMKAKFKDPEYARAHKIRQQNRKQNNENKTPFSITNGIDTYGPFKLQKESYGKIPIGVTSLNRLFRGYRVEINGYSVVKHK